MKLIALITLCLLLALPAQADVIKPCPPSSPRCQVPVYLPSHRVIVIWWGDGFYCRIRGKETPFAPCKPYRVNLQILGWILASGR